MIAYLKQLFDIKSEKAKDIINDNNNSKSN